MSLDLVLHFQLVRAFSSRIKTGDKTTVSSNGWIDVNKAFRKISNISGVFSKEYLHFLRISILLVGLDASFIATYAFGFFGKVL